MARNKRSGRQSDELLPVYDELIYDELQNVTRDLPGEEPPQEEKPAQESADGQSDTPEEALRKLQSDADAREEKKHPHRKKRKTKAP